MGSSKPTILCLHGGGTNSIIFSVQLARLLRILYPYYNFIYADGPVPALPGPDVLPVFEGCGPYLRWVTPASIEEGVRTSATRAAEERAIDAVLAKAVEGHQGAIVGVMGFSAGAALATDLLLRKQARAEGGVVVDDADHDGNGNGNGNGADRAWRDLEFGILLNGVPSSWRGTGEGPRIRFPTVHVHGLEDPWLESSRVLLGDCFVQDVAKVMEFEGGHHLPNTGPDNERLKKLVLEAARKGSSGREIE
ncbi:MAG: hypothetical protein M1818_000004 [Claussenomyces sp. TS43310]|nr:MAG: hypothetical protein M1818_000004 [Claussenomyces sp. TS43310]